VIVDPIDDANPNATNAMLKILEEPPPETTFFLVSHRPGNLLPTIRSRCHPIAMRSLSDADVRSVLAASRPDLPDDQLDRAVALSRGSPRRAFEALLLGDAGALTALQAWLRDPAQAPAAHHLALADGLSGRDTTEARFGREIILDWLAGEAKAAAQAGAPARPRLASANELWDKALAIFADTDEYNLDARQTLVSVFDMIKRHVQTHLAAAEPL
jgi:DNA polymerase-3 subunit delta'